MTKTNERPAFTVGEGIPKKPHAKWRFKGPVRWLLSSHLIGSLKQIILYSFTKRALDVRDWMLPSVDASFANQAGEFWFDYIADTGDGQLGVYDIAYLCLSDLHHSAGAPSDSLSFDATGADLSLPRGRFLMVGGDTAYHVADYPTLASRLQAPFEWAFVDLANEKGHEPEARPLYGIPGNHDYYDELDGFNRQFRRPVSGDETTWLKGSDGLKKGPQLCLRGFRRTQETSYVALHLPHEWWLWGFDSENGNDDGKLDFRQTQFFRTRGRPNGEAMPPPEKLIVATSEPAIARRLAPTSKDRIIKSFAVLGLRHPLLADGREDLAPGTCRLDLSGDTHHYERYDADPDPSRPEQDAGPTTARGSEPAPYASVVSGLGGAFLHPSDIHHSGPSRRAVFPRPADSRNEIAMRLLNPFVVFWGGLATVVGGLVAALNVLALWKSPTCSAALHAVLRPVLRLGAPDSDELTNRDQFLVHSSFLLALVVLALGLWGSGALRRWYHQKSRERPRSRAWNWLGIGIGIVAASAPLVATLIVGDEVSARSFTVDVIVALLVVGLFGALLYFAVALGAKDHPWPRKLAFLVLGLTHALVQVVLPLAIVRAHAWPLAGALAVLPWILWALRRAVGRHWPSGLLPWLWFVLVAATFVSLRAYSPPESYAPDGWGAALALAGCVLVAGTYLTAFWFGFYLAASQEWLGHFNDIGGAARIARYQQLIRFKLTAEGLTGYVIAIDAPEVHGSKLRPRIIDKFTIAPD
jgi:hypothetical protein